MIREEFDDLGSLFNSTAAAYRATAKGHSQFVSLRKLTEYRGADGPGMIAGMLAGLT